MRAVAMLFACAALLGCDPNARTSDVGAAQTQNVAQGIARVGPLRNGAYDFEIGLPLMGRTAIVHTEQICQGSAGSVLPPLAFEACGGELLKLPLLPLKKLTEWLGGDTSGRRVMLAGALDAWVEQKVENQCWAASIAISRNLLRLQRLDQSNIRDLVRNECPALDLQSKGADTYQILFTLAKLIKVQDRGRLRPQLCDDGTCIVKALLNQRPVIVLNSGHAVVIVGADYLADPTMTRGEFFASPQYYYILDPAGGREIKKKEPISICTAAAFIAL